MALLSQLIVRFGADIADFTSDMNRAARLSKKTGVDMERGLKVAASAVGAAFAASAVQAGAFEKSMAEVSTLVDTSTTDMNELSQEVLAMSRAMGTNARENASALYQIISAGASNSADAMNLLTVSNKLAIGGVTDVRTAADGLTTVLNAYGMSAGEASAVSDTMFATMRAGKTTIGELAQNYGNVATIAAKVGVGFNELSAATAALTKVGIGTSEAMNGIRGVLAAVLKQGDQSVQMADELGVAFSASAIRAKGFANWLAEVQAKSGGSEEKLAKLFGRVEGLTAVLALGANGGEEFNSILEDIGEGAGATDEAFGKMGDTIDRQLDTFMSTVNTLAISIGTRLLPHLNQILGMFTALLTPVKTTTDAFRDAARAVDALTEAQKENAAVSQQVAAIRQAESAISQLEQQIRDLEEIQSKWYNQMADQGPAFQQRAGVIQDLKDRQKELWREIQTTTVELEENERAARDASLAYKEMDSVIADELAENMAYLDRLIALDLDPTLQEITTTAEGVTFANALLGSGVEDIGKKIDALMPKVAKHKKETEGMAAVMEQAWQNLDTTFQNVWTNFFETGKLSLSSIKDLFLDTLAQMAHAAVTRPIMAQIGAQMQGGNFIGGLAQIFGQQVGSGGWSWQGFNNSAAGTGLAMAAGSMFGSWLGQHTAPDFLGTHSNWAEVGSQVGAAVGAVIGSIIPVIGTALGALLGSIAGAIDGAIFQKLFGKNYLPQLQIAGTGRGVADKIGNYGNKRIPFSTAFGDFMIYNQNDLGTEGDQIVNDFIQMIKDFDQGLSRVMTSSQLESTKENLANWGYEWTGEAITIQNILTHRFDQVLEHFGFLTAGIGEYVNQFSDLEARTNAFLAYVASWNAMAEQLVIFTRSDLASIEQVGVDLRNSFEKLRDSGIELRSAFADFDSTPEAMTRIAEAIQVRYETELRYIKAIDSLISEMGASIERQRASLRGMLGVAEDTRTPTQIMAEARTIMARLGTAGSPEEIASIVSQVQSLIDLAARNASNLPEELARGVEGITQSGAIRQALLLLDQLESSATSRANILRENAIAEAAALREEAAEFAEAQQIRLDDIELNTDATTDAVNNQTDVLSGQNDQLIDLISRLIATMEDSKSSLGEVTIRGVA